MKKTDLDVEFLKAVEKISNLEEEIAPDIMLRFYAFYKQANYGNTFFLTIKDSNLISAFKFNAWMQLKGMKPEDAKKEYIQLAKTINYKH